MKSRKRKLNYDEGPDTLLFGKFPQGKPGSDSTAQADWLRRMEGFDIAGTSRTTMKCPGVNKISVGEIAKKFKDSANYCELQSSQESEIDIDWLPQSDGENSTEEPRFGSKNPCPFGVDEVFQCSGFAPTPEIEVQSTPEAQHSPIIYNNSVIHGSPEIPNSPIILPFSASPSGADDVTDSPVIRSRRVADNDDLIQRKMLFSLKSLWPPQNNCAALNVDDVRMRSACGNSEESETDSSGEDSILSPRDDIHSDFKPSSVLISEHESEEDIKSYDSDIEKAKADQSPDAETSSISSPPPPPPPGPVINQSAQPDVGPFGLTRPSDLNDRIQRIFVTPDKNLRRGNDESAVETTSKKKQKFVKGGFAEQLSRLVSRQRTSNSCWTRRGKQSSSEDSDKALSCRVITCATDHSHLVAKCRVSHGDGLSKESLVLFNARTSQQCKIKPGSVLKIHPPWQVLKLSAGLDVILNTLHCNIQFQPDETDHNRIEGNHLTETLEKTVATWCCSCSEEFSYSSACYQNLGSTSSISTLHSHFSTVMEDSRNRDKCLDVTVGLETFCSNRSSAVPRDSGLSSSILECIEQKGGDFDVDISFCAVVQRVFCCYAMSSKAGTKELQWSILIQDCHGFLCEVFLPMNFEPGSVWDEVTAVPLGCKWAFYNLRVGRRLTKPKFVRLFSVIDSVWKLDSVSSATCHEDSASTPAEIRPPSFCYALHATGPKASCQLHCSLTSVIFSPHSYQMLRDLTFDRSPAVVRVSFQARILHVRESNSLQHMYVTDGSLLDATTESLLMPYVVVTVDKSVVTQERMQQSVVFQDISNKFGEFLADEYSRITNSEQQMNISPHLPMLSDTSELFSLVTIQGRIIDVDEDTAYAWSVCDLCENSDLGANFQNSFLFCDICKRPVINPLTKMRLDISVVTSEIPDTTVKVKLLQNTIESLLPSTQSEAYEIEHVLGQSIQLSGIITSITSHVTDHRQITVEEINLSIQKMDTQ